MDQSSPPAQAGHPTLGEATKMGWICIKYLTNTTAMIELEKELKFHHPQAGAHLAVQPAFIKQRPVLYNACS